MPFAARRSCRRRGSAVILVSCQRSPSCISEIASANPGRMVLTTSEAGNPGEGAIKDGAIDQGAAIVNLHDVYRGFGRRSKPLRKAADIAIRWTAETTPSFCVGRQIGLIGGDASTGSSAASADIGACAAST